MCPPYNIRRMRRLPRGIRGTETGAVRYRDYWGDLHAQHALLSYHSGRARDCLYVECQRRSDERRGRKRGGDLFIVPPTGEMAKMAAGAHKMLPGIRHRPLQLSLVSTVTDCRLKKRNLCGW